MKHHSILFLLSCCILCSTISFSQLPHNGITKPQSPPSKKLAPINTNGQQKITTLQSQFPNTNPSNKSAPVSPHQNTQQLPNQAFQEERPAAIQYDFTSQAHIPSTAHYYNTYDQLLSMLEGKEPQNLRKAVFLTENAFYENQIAYSLYEADLESYIDVIKTAIIQAGYDLNNPTARKWGIQQFLSDTIQLKNEHGEIIHTHLPFKYDFEDPFGKEDWSKLFVMKMMSSKQGQCHSMPLLYLILAEALEVEAWLAYSPSHTYIKLRDSKGNWWNYEATNGSYTTDAWMQSSGFVKAEALRNRIYMDTISKKEVIAAQLTDLAMGYASKYGFDPFVMKCLDKTLDHDPTNIIALKLKADYQTYQCMYVLDQLGKPPVEQLNQYPQAHRLYQDVHQNYQQIAELGFEEMPEEIYLHWLKSFESEKAKHPKKIIRP